MSESTSKEVFAGSSLEIDAAGDYLINTTEALSGDVRLKLAEGRAFVIEIAGDPVFEVSQAGGKVRIDLGGGTSQRLVLGDKLKELLNEFFLKYDTHTHGSSVGPTTPPVAPSGAQVTDEHLASVSCTK